MKILLDIPDNIGQKLDDFCYTKRTTRTAILRAMICKLVGEPIPLTKPRGRPKQIARAQELQ